MAHTLFYQETFDLVQKANKILMSLCDSIQMGLANQWGGSLFQDIHFMMKQRNKVNRSRQTVIRIITDSTIL